MRGFFGRAPRSASGRAATGPRHTRAPRPEPLDHGPGAGRFWRFGIAGLAAALCLATQAAADVRIGPVPPLAAAVLVFLLPRAGWALAATAGAVALAVAGEVGSAMFLVLPAAVAAFAAMTPLPRIFDGALAGAGAFAWVVAVQAMSGTSLALSVPPEIGPPEDVRQYADVALDALSQFAQPAYTASLGLWCLAGAVAVVLVDRRARIAAWGALAVVFVAAQIAIGEAMDAPVPPLTAVVAVLALVAAFCAAAAARRAGRVFAA
jgi:hypothetical protein